MRDHLGNEMHIPDRLCVQEGKPFYDEAILKKGLRVWIDNEEHLDDVFEYCISGRWARLQVKGPDGHFMKNIFGKGVRIKRHENVDIRVEWK